MKFAPAIPASDIGALTYAVSALLALEVKTLSPNRFFHFAGPIAKGCPRHARSQKKSALVKSGVPGGDADVGNAYGPITLEIGLFRPIRQGSGERFSRSWNGWLGR